MPARSNWVGKFCFITALAVSICLSGSPLPLSAQEQQGQQQPQPQQPQQQQPQQQALSQEEIQQLVAPIALYPDALLAQVLTASTYPLEVAMAARWSEKNPNLKGAALEEAMQKQPWDPSVKGLTSVPQVLAMMNEKLDWTNQLGEAFLAQPDDIQNAVQALRAKADAAGNLKSSKEQKVRRVAATPSPGYVGPPEYIVIEPVEPDYIYVPVYDPVVVYGVGYWSPAYVPFFWYPPWWTVGPAFGFGAALFVGPALWYHYNWGYGGFAAIQTNTALYSKFNKVNISGGGQFQNWKFDPAHHGGVQFKNTKLQQQYGNLGGKGVQGIQTDKAIQGIQTGKGIQGIQTGKDIKGVKTDKHIQGVQTGKQIQGVKTSKQIQGVQTGKHIQGVQTGKQTQGVQTGKQIQGVQTGRQIQGVQTGRRIQGVQTGKGVQGSRGKGMGQRDH
ncbi:MAG: DUF3300 domain-containing protein [Sphingobacteriales bacterium]